MTSKSLLSDFYGALSSGSAADGAIQESPEDAMEKEMEAERRKQAEKKSKTSLESEQFDSKLYLNNLLAQNSMRDLIQHDNQMISSKRALDSEMQTLVYENYNSFISATDMIRRMKSNVESMETQMANLLSNMNAISNNCAGIESNLSPNRTKVENLLGVSRLLKRLEFIFELPGKLKKSIELGAYEQAVQYYRISSSILQQYKHLKSFEHIRKESEQIMTELKKKLRGFLADPSISTEQQLSYTAMLVVDLAEPDSKELMHALQEQQRTKFQALMNRAQEIANKKENAAARKSSISMTQEQKSKENAENDGDVAAVPVSAASSSEPSLLSLLSQQFLSPFVLFTDTYLSTLVRPYDSKLKKLQTALADQKRQLADQQADEKSRGAGASSAAPGAPTPSSVDAIAASLGVLTSSVNLCQETLVNLSLDLFSSYFTMARRELIKRATLSPNDDAQQAILLFTSTIKSFYASLAKSFEQIPQAKLGDRAAELVHHAITSCVESVCEHVLNNAVKQLTQLHQQVIHWKPTQQLPIPTPAGVSGNLRKALEEGLSLLVVVLSTRDYLPENLSFSFSDLAHAHFHQLLQQLSKEIAYRTPRRNNGPVYLPVGPSLLSKSIEARLATELKDDATPENIDRDARNPLFFLYLSQIAVQQETRDIPAALKTLQKFFPVSAAAPRGHRGMKESASDAFLADLSKKTKEHAQVLLLRYCETHGFQLTQLVRTLMLHVNLNDESRHPSEFVDRIESHLHLITTELGLLFAKSREEGLYDRNHDSSGRDLLSGRHHTPAASATSARGPASKDLTKPGAGAAGNVRAGLGAGAGGINRDIRRLFTQKSATFPGMDAEGAPLDLAMNRTQPLAAICKILFKSMMETVRMERLSSAQFQQLQLDVFTLRSELPHILPDTNADSSKILYVLLDETMNAAIDRSKDAKPLEEYMLGEALDNSRAVKPSPLLAADTPSTSQSAVDEPAAASSSAVAPTAVQPQPTGALARLVLSSPTSTAS